MADFQGDRQFLLIDAQSGHHLWAERFDKQRRSTSRKGVGVGGDALDATGAWSAVLSVRVSVRAHEVRAQKNLQFDEVLLDSRHALVFTHGSFTTIRIAFSQGFCEQPTNVAREESRACLGASHSAHLRRGSAVTVIAASRLGGTDGPTF